MSLPSLWNFGRKLHKPMGCKTNFKIILKSFTKICKGALHLVSFKREERYVVYAVKSAFLGKKPFDFV